MNKYQEIGISVIDHYFEYYKKVFLDDETEFFPTLKTIINGIVSTCKADKNKIKKELENHAKNLYCDLWLSHAEEDRKDIDVASERDKAINTFNQIYTSIR